jgi:adenosylcobinamide-GDP ribazoletransferase
VAYDDDPGADGAARFTRRAERMLRAWLGDLALAARLLTRLPFLPGPDAAAPGPAEPRPLGRAVRVFPLVGAGVGLASGVIYAILSAIGLPDILAAIVALAAAALLTGALHEDGLADTADGFGGGRTREHKLAIMRDSRIGAYGVIALVLVLVAKLGAVVDLDRIGLVMAALIASGATSRAFLPALMRWLEPARADGLGAGAGRPPESAVYAGLAVALVIALIMLNWTGLVAMIIAGAGAWLMAQLAKRQIGGQTGDVLGATQMITEVLFLLTVAAIR